MKNALIPVLLLLSGSLSAQYYYNDIVGTQETNRQMKTYIENKVRTVSSTGIDNRGMKATDFSEFHEVKENGRALKASSIVNFNKSVIYSRFDDQLRVISMIDSTTNLESITTYTYDNTGRLSLVKNTVKDSAADFNQVETHHWIYTADGKPEKMWRVITTTGTNNSIDSLEVRLAKDEDGNPGEERTYKRGIETGYLYYYYDDKDRLSDVVRYNKKVKKLLPDLMFEYDANDRVAQKTTTTSSINIGYLKWRYIYNAQGLKIKEVLFLNKEQTPNGRIDYTYTFF